MPFYHQQKKESMSSVDLIFLISQVHFHHLMIIVFSDLLYKGLYREQFIASKSRLCQWAEYK